MSNSEYTTLEVRVHKTVPMPPTSGLKELVTEWGMDAAMQESFWVVTYDAARNIRRVTEVAKGSYHEVLVSIPAVLAAVLKSGADRFVVVHNHPSGSVEPSAKDIGMTHTIMTGANAAGLYFEDHVIVGPGDAFHSMTEHGEIVPAYPVGGGQIVRARSKIAKVNPKNLVMLHG